MKLPDIIDLSTIGRGFDDIALDSQVVFRQVLSALSRPGEIQEIRLTPEVPNGLHSAAGALLLALLDQDTHLWLSASMIEARVGPYLRFHTGCRLTANPADADFALVGNVSELPELSCLSHGTEEYPERSATVVLQVNELTSGSGWTLSGPGIEFTSNLKIDGLDSQFIEEWKMSASEFPKGIDLYVANGSRLAALSRTTRIEE